MSSENVSARFSSVPGEDFQPRPNSGLGISRKFSTVTNDGLFFVPGEYRLSGESNCFSWPGITTGLCLVTENTGFAPGIFDVKGIVKYDTPQDLMGDNAKRKMRTSETMGVQGDHYSGRIVCEPVELMAPPVQMVADVYNPRARDPNATHEYLITGCTVVKKRRTDTPGLTLVVREVMPARRRYRVEGRVICQVGSTELRGMALIPLLRTNVERFRLDGKVHLSLCSDEDSQQPPSSAPEDVSQDEDARELPPPITEFRSKSCKCRPITP